MTGFAILSVLFVLSVLLQTTVSSLIAVADIRPNLPLLLLIPVVLRMPVVQSVGWAFAVGLLYDLASGTPVGLSSLAYCVAAFVVRTMTRDWVEVGYRRMMLVWSVGAGIFESLVSEVYYLGSDLGFVGVLFRYVFPSVVYDVAFGLLILAALPVRWWRRL